MTRHQSKFAAADPTALAADYAEDGAMETRSAGPQQGRAQITAYYQRWMQAFPGMAFKVEHVVAEENRAAVFFVVSGTHEGSFLGLAPTHKRIEFHGVMLLRFSDGLIAHQRFVYDFGGLLIKLGVVKVKPGA